MKFRRGSATTTLVLSLGAILGLAGGGYMLSTGNSLCSLVAGCGDHAFFAAGCPSEPIAAARGPA